MRRASLMLFVGGCFMESRRQTLVCATLAFMAKLCRLPVATLGATAFPYRTWWARTVYRWVFGQMNWITVREPSAFEAIRALQVSAPLYQLPDPRFCLPAMPAAAGALLRRFGIDDPDKPMVILTTRYMHGGLPAWVRDAHGYTAAARDSACRALAAAADALARDANIVVLPLHPSFHDDEAAAEQIRAFMECPKRLQLLAGDLSAQEAIDLIGASALVVATRLGTAVFAIAAQTPLIALAYETRLLDTMAGVGLQDYASDWRDTDPDAFARLAVHAWKGRERLAATLRTNSRNLLTETKRQVELIRALLPSTAPPPGAEWHAPDDRA